MIAAVTLTVVKIIEVFVVVMRTSDDDPVAPEAPVAPASAVVLVEFQPFDSLGPVKRAPVERIGDAEWTVEVAVEPVVIVSTVVILIVVVRVEAFEDGTGANVIVVVPMISLEIGV